MFEVQYKQLGQHFKQKRSIFLDQFFICLGISFDWSWTQRTKKLNIVY